MCQTADNCSVNLKVVELHWVPHVVCKNHLLILEVNPMVKQTRDLELMLKSVHKRMGQLKKKMMNTLLLRNLACLVPVLNNRFGLLQQMY